MPEHKPPQKLELHDREVGERACLAAFFAHDSYADMSGLDHVNIIRSISNRQCAFLGLDTFDESDKSSFLFRRGAIDDEAFCIQERFYQIISLLTFLILHSLDLLNQNLDCSTADQEVFFTS